MARSYSYCQPSIFRYSPSPKSPLPIDSFLHRINRRPSIVHIAIRCGGTSSLNAPLEPASLPGRSLGGVLRNDPDSFYDAVSSELIRLSNDRDAALARMDLSFGSSEASLHRRIAELKEEEYQPVVEDIMYMIVYKRFLEIGVPLVPSLDKCLYNGRLEISPSKEGDLEAIHAFEVLEMIREYVNSVLDHKAGSSVMQHLSQVYAASISYGYFLKSASLRHRLEHDISVSYLDIIPSNRWAFLFGSGFYGVKSIALGEFSAPRSTTLSQAASKTLKLYVQGLDQDALQACSKMRSKAAMDLVSKHCSALFVIEHSFLVDSSKPMLTSLASLKRLILEAVAFGCFLWDAEEYVDGVFKLEN